jgi:hypothetical protein
LQGFVSYSHKDADMVLPFYGHLKVTTQPCGVHFWIDEEIRVGDLWDGKIREALAKAQVFIFCVSINFINSRYIQQVELKDARDKHNRGEAIIIPVLMKDCPFEAVEFLKELQILPKGAKPITSKRPYDKGYTETARAIAKLLQERMEPA